MADTQGRRLFSQCYTKRCRQMQASRIVLIAGDADFVPAAKLARREGVDFILDAMHQPISDDLFEHIDGLWTTYHANQRKNGTAQKY